MEETLHDKMLAVLKEKTKGVYFDGAHSALFEIEKLAIQAQIDLLQKQKAKLLKWSQEAEKMVLQSELANAMRITKIDTIEFIIVVCKRRDSGTFKTTRIMTQEQIARVKEPIEYHKTCEGFVIGSLGEDLIVWQTDVDRMVTYCTLNLNRLNKNAIFRVTKWK